MFRSLFVIAAVVLTAPSVTKAATDLERVQGTWLGLFQGANVTLTITGQDAKIDMDFQGNSASANGKIQLDEATKSVDLSGLDGGTGVLHGLYDLDAAAKDLKLCLASDGGQPRPASFDHCGEDPNGSTVLITLARK